jgi:hypothetical protein
VKINTPGKIKNPLYWSRYKGGEVDIGHWVQTVYVSGNQSKIKPLMISATPAGNEILLCQMKGNFTIFAFSCLSRTLINMSESIFYQSTFQPINFSTILHPGS